MTSSTFDDERDKLLNLPWILEKSIPLMSFVISSMFCWLVTTTHAFPWHLIPNSSTIVWRLSINFVSSAMYWPTSSTKNIMWWLFPLSIQYCFTSSAKFSIVSSVFSSAFSAQILASLSLIKPIFTTLWTISSWIK